MRKVFVAAVVAATLVPVAAFALGAMGKVKTWNDVAKVITLDNNTACALGAAVQIPAGLAVGKDVVLTYTTIGTVNTCTEVVVK
ncbi:MAG: hypothetical protein EXQ88_04355 [Alphaproteobacteria bacterium]|nr:hypothetical protein [Alphaproteobacteria bacterium]